VETDKAVMDLEAFYDGYLAGPLAAADSEQPVGAVIGYITDSAEKDKEEPASMEKKTAVTKPAPASVQPDPVTKIVVKTGFMQMSWAGPKVCRPYAYHV